jgi:hypothetical protein
MFWPVSTAVELATARLTAPKGLGRNEVAIGDVVGFVDRDQNHRTGKIIRLNDKTVTLQCIRGNLLALAGVGLRMAIGVSMHLLLAKLEFGQRSQPT